MKQLLILSGKGGTGKTTVATSFIKLSKAKAYADCDVDAPNLHLINNENKEYDHKAFYGLDKAYIDKDLCIGCGLCYQQCRFDAIEKLDDKYQVDYFACEGCSLCAEICPTNAIKMKNAQAGDLMLAKNDEVFSTAKLKMCSGNSGLLVMEVKNRLKKNSDSDFAIIDGSPGIGCPVIASLSGADTVLIVSEPSASGISDLKRIIETAKRFNPKLAVCVNKYDSHLENTEKIIDFCDKKSIDFVGLIPNDQMAIKAVNNNKAVVEYDCKAKRAIEDVYSKTMKVFLK